jgi:hypothetical protein
MSGRSFMRGTVHVLPEFDFVLPVLSLSSSWLSIDDPRVNDNLGFMLLKLDPYGSLMPGGIASRPPPGWPFAPIQINGNTFEFVVGFKDDRDVQSAFISLINHISKEFTIERDLTELELTYDYAATPYGTRTEKYSQNDKDAIALIEKNLAMRLFLFYANELNQHQLSIVESHL